MTANLHEQLRFWWCAFRYHFVPPSIFPVTLGTTIAWTVNQTFNPTIFFLVLFAVVINHLALNMTDDYYDYKHSVDQLQPGEKNPYTGGSRTLSSKQIKPQHMKTAFIACYTITIIIGLYLTITIGLPILIFGIIGILCSIFYTMPPIKISHHGLGELIQLINFGTIIGLGSYYTQTQTITLEVFLATLPLGIMLFSMITINEIPDYQEDKQAGKLTLIARYGKKTGVKIYTTSWIITYTLIITTATLQLITPIALISLVSIPLVYRSIKRLKQHYENPIELAPANLDMIKAHSLTGFGLIVAYILQGLINGSNTQQLTITLTLLAMFYVPAIIPLLKKR
ncbi:1,4-dihydroxy-2-naphthoate octaprenyltransferase [[Eubacterium] cellulosolvens]